MHNRSKRWITARRALRTDVKGVINEDGEGLINIDQTKLDQKVVEGMTNRIMFAFLKFERNIRGGRRGKKVPQGGGV